MPTNAIHGRAASPGIAIGHIRRFDVQKLVVEQIRSNDMAGELARLDNALEQARREVHTLYEQAKREVGAHEAAIFEAHELFLSDPELLQQVRTTIEQQSSDAAYAWQEGTRQYADQLRGLDDEYLAARAVDMEDVAQRVLRILQGQQEQTIQLQGPTIIVASDLTPSQTVRFDKAQVRAFCTAAGGPTSHVAILAKALGIPAITGLGTALDGLQDNLQAIVDGTTGEILLEPDTATLATYSSRAQALVQQQQAALASAYQPAYTRDGTHVEIVANIGAPGDVSEALAYGAEGIGLLRTEFLFLDRANAPSEEEQTDVYRSILEAMGPRPVVVRTFDIGGDKPAPYLQMPVEMNPFLGVRGLRLALARPDLLQSQLRALLRAGTGHLLRIMFPMVSSSEEVMAIREQVQRARETLEAEGRDVASNVEIGIMVEVPAAALLADVLALEVDFFSIGTNDLTQYTLAADRTNAETATLADALHPAVLRLIQMVVEAAHSHKRRVGLCGELAGDPLAIPILLGLGLDELSMTPKAIPTCKQQIRSYSLADAREIAQQALKLRNAEEVRALLTEKMPRK